MTRDLPPSLRDLAQRQCGVLSREQLLESGLTDDIVMGRVSRGSWQRLHRGVYALFAGRPSRESMLWAAVLHAGAGAALSHQTAAELGGLTDKEGPPIHVTVPAQRRVCKTPGIVVHLSGRVAAATHPARTLPQTRIEETVLDLWQAARSLDEAVGWLTAALGRRLTTQGKLLTALTERNRMRWRRELAELLSPDAAGQHSILEHRYVRDVERPHGLPRARRQAVIRRNGRNEYRDSLYEEYDTVVELDGQFAHPAEMRWRDIRRDNAATVTDVGTLRYGWLDVTTRPCEVAADVAARLTRHGYLGARPCSASCPVGQPVEHDRPPGLLARSPQSGQPGWHSPAPAEVPAGTRRTETGVTRPVAARPRTGRPLGQGPPARPEPRHPNTSAAGLRGGPSR